MSSPLPPSASRALWAHRGPLLVRASLALFLIGLAVRVAAITQYATCGGSAALFITILSTNLSLFGAGVAALVRSRTRTPECRAATRAVPHTVWAAMGTADAAASLLAALALAALSRGELSAALLAAALPLSLPAAVLAARLRREELAPALRRPSVWVLLALWAGATGYTVAAGLRASDAPGSSLLLCCCALLGAGALTAASALGKEHVLRGRARTLPSALAVGPTLALRPPRIDLAVALYYTQRWQSLATFCLLPLAAFYVFGVAPGALGAVLVDGMRCACVAPAPLAYLALLPAFNCLAMLLLREGGARYSLLLQALPLPLVPLALALPGVPRGGPVSINAGVTLGLLLVALLLAHRPIRQGCGRLAQPLPSSDEEPGEEGEALGKEGEPLAWEEGLLAGEGAPGEAAALENGAGAVPVGIRAQAGE